jgi:hypothetical protein
MKKIIRYKLYLQTIISIMFDLNMTLTIIRKYLAELYFSIDRYILSKKNDIYIYIYIYNLILAFMSYGGYCYCFYYNMEKCGGVLLWLI